MKILVISGSLRAESYNTALARSARDIAPAGVEIELYDGLASIPPYDQDLDEGDGETPTAVRDLRDRIEGADAIFIVTPEYNGSIPGVLKNAIDWASARHRGSSLANKTVATAGATTGQYGAIWAQQDLGRILGVAGARVVGGELPFSRAHTLFDEHGELHSPTQVARLREHLDTLLAAASPLAIAV